MSPSTEIVLLAKQPIYHTDKTLFGHELLFRSRDRLNAWQVGEDQATCEVLVNYFTSISPELDQADRPLFINVSESFVLSEAFLPIEKHQVIIELLERIEVTPALLAAVQRWKQKGYRFALDDYDFDPRWDPLLPWIDFIKVDVLEADLDQVAQNVADKRSQVHAVWIAERIEDEATFQRCIDMGCTMFQGYFLARPKEILGNSIRAGSMVTAEIIRQASNPATSIADVAALVIRDPKLSMQLLRLINSSLFSLPRQVNDIEQAITLLGLNTLKKWALLLAFVADARCHLETSRLVLIRARAAELFLTQKTHDHDLVGRAFLSGLISGVDLLLEIEPARFIAQLQLDQSIRTAVLNGAGVIGNVLTKIRDIETFLNRDWKKNRELDLELMQAYGDAQLWSDEVVDSLF